VWSLVLVSPDVSVGDRWDRRQRLVDALDTPPADPVVDTRRTGRVDGVDNGCGVTAHVDGADLVVVG
jgi:hypothetical protein